MPPSPSKNGRGKKAKGRVTKRPYTDTYLIGLRIGLSCEELREISYPAILWLIHEYNLMNADDESETDCRDATASDVRALMMM